jgi:hypothetical protein
MRSGHTEQVAAAEQVAAECTHGNLFARRSTRWAGASAVFRAVLYLSIYLSLLRIQAP